MNDKQYNELLEVLKLIALIDFNENTVNKLLI